MFGSGAGGRSGASQSAPRGGLGVGIKRIFSKPGSSDPPAPSSRPQAPVPLSPPRATPPQALAPGHGRPVLGDEEELQAHFNTASRLLADLRRSAVRGTLFRCCCVASLLETHSMAQGLTATQAKVTEIKALGVRTAGQARARVRITERVCHNRCCTLSCAVRTIQVLVNRLHGDEQFLWQQCVARCARCALSPASSAHGFARLT